VDMVLLAHRMSLLGVRSLLASIEGRVQSMSRMTMIPATAHSPALSDETEIYPPRNVHGTTEFLGEIFGTNTDRLPCARAPKIGYPHGGERPGRANSVAEPTTRGGVLKER
jgi:hypothetical protein